MGRPERPVDPDAGPVQRFAHELRSLRREAGGPSYRAMAHRTGLSVTALSRAASGERLPSAAVVRAYALACGADPDTWERRLRTAAADARAGGETDGESPYQGLARFEPGDRELFFGRDGLAEDALKLVREHRFAVVLGASGSGKSSLLRAGLMPRLETLVREARCTAEVRLITPGARPAATHERLLAPEWNGPERVVVVDQFEEIFTLCRDRAERWRFVERLLAATDPAARLRVVIAVGGTFYGRCAEHPGLASALRHHSLLVRPMTRAELREAVVRPATAAGLRVERELTERIVEEVVEQPGGLPMLSHALRETWRRRRSGVLTLAAYEEAGGVHGAIAAAAEEVYGRLTPAQARTAQRLLLALIAPGDGTPDTRRPLPRADFREWRPDPEAQDVLMRLVRARLVTLDEENVELAHEALITGWPRLQCWIEENRERLRQHRHLTEAARIWQEHGRDPGTLYRGARLALADVLFTRETHDDDLTGQERAFLSASRVAHRMEHWTAARMRGRIRKLGLALTVVMAGALVAGQIAWQENRTADRERTRAEARHAAALAGRERTADPRTGTLLSIAAWRLAPLPESRAALFDAFTAPERDVFTAPGRGPGTQDFLTDSGRTLLTVGDGTWSTWNVTTHQPTGSGHLPDAPVTAVTPDGRTLALRVDGDHRLWRLPADGETTAHHRTAPGPVLAFGPGGNSYVVTGGGSDETARLQLRAVADDRLLFEPGGEGTNGFAPAPALTPAEATRPATATEATPSATPAEATPSATPVAVIPSADDRLVALCGSDRRLTLWDTGSRSERDGAWRGFATSGCSATTVVFSPDGTRLAAASGTRLRVWDTGSGRRLADLPHPGASHLAFTPDGTFLAAAGKDRTTVWRLSAPDSPVFSHPLAEGPVTALAWSPDSPALRYLAAGTVHTLDLAAPLTSTWLDRPLDRALLSPDGRLLATAQRYADGYRVRLRDTRTGHRVADLPRIPAYDDGGGAEDGGSDGHKHSDGDKHSDGGGPLMAFSPDSRAFAYGSSAAGSSAASFVVWDVPARRVRAALTPVGPSARPLPAGPSAGEVRSIALTPGGRRLLLSRRTSTGSLTGEVWDTGRRTLTDRKSVLAASLKAALSSGYTGPAAALPFGWETRVPLGPPDGTDVVALSPDGSHLATGGAFGSVTIWDGRTAPHQAAVIPAPATAADCAVCARVTALAFSPDGRTLAVGHGSGALRLWDVPTRQPLGDGLATSGEAIRSLAFSADRGTVYASSAHVPVQRYPVDPVRIVTRLCARVGRTLTPAEWRTHLPGAPYRTLCGTSAPAGTVVEAGPANPAATSPQPSAPAEGESPDAPRTPAKPETDERNPTPLPVTEETHPALAPTPRDRPWKKADAPGPAGKKGEDERKDEESEARREQEKQEKWEKPEKWAKQDDDKERRRAGPDENDRRPGKKGDGRSS